MSAVFYPLALVLLLLTPFTDTAFTLPTDTDETDTDAA